MFQMAVLILSGHKFESPNLESLQIILLMFIDDHTCKNTQQKKRVVTKVHKQLAHNSVNFTSVVDQSQNV